jgi:hypothetical protein
VVELDNGDFVEESDHTHFDEKQDTFVPNEGVKRIVEIHCEQFIGWDNFRMFVFLQLPKSVKRFVVDHQMFIGGRDSFVLNGATVNCDEFLSAKVSQLKRELQQIREVQEFEQLEKEQEQKMIKLLKNVEIVFNDYNKTSFFESMFKKFIQVLDEMKVEEEEEEEEKLVIEVIEEHLVTPVIQEIFEDIKKEENVKVERIYEDYEPTVDNKKVFGIYVLLSLTTGAQLWFKFYSKENLSIFRNLLKHRKIYEGQVLYPLEYSVLDYFSNPRPPDIISYSSASVAKYIVYPLKQKM